MRLVLFAIAAIGLVSACEPIPREGLPFMQTSTFTIDDPAYTPGTFCPEGQHDAGLC